LFGFDFDVEYRPERLSIAADALSRREDNMDGGSQGTAV
jgi:hypothetical protein